MLMYATGLGRQQLTLDSGKERQLTFFSRARVKASTPPVCLSINSTSNRPIRHHLAEALC